MKHEISDIDLKNAYIQSAQIVAKYGDKYLPIFERIENEFNKRKEESATMKRAIDIALLTQNHEL